MRAEWPAGNNQLCWKWKNIRSILLAQLIWTESIQSISLSWLNMKIEKVNWQLKRWIVRRKLKAFVSVSWSEMNLQHLKCAPLYICSTKLWYQMEEIMQVLNKLKKGDDNENDVHIISIPLQWASVVGKVRVRILRSIRGLCSPWWLWYIWMDGWRSISPDQRTLWWWITVSLSGLIWSLLRWDKAGLSISLFGHPIDH